MASDESISSDRLWLEVCAWCSIDIKDLFGIIHTVPAANLYVEHQRDAFNISTTLQFNLLPFA